MHEEIEILLRLFVTLLLCGVLGWERQANGKQAGLRTHILVGVGAALFVSLAELMVRHFSTRYSEEILQMDPTRVLEAVAAGVSFLGAGTIFVSRGGGERVQGLTTAAAIWSTAAVGLAAGLGRYILAAGVTLLVFAVLQVLGKWERRGKLPGVPPKPPPPQSQSSPLSSAASPSSRPPSSSPPPPASAPPGE